MAELGYAVTRRPDEDNWDLMFPNSVRVYGKMLREDAQVASIIKGMTLPIERSTWRIDPNGAPDEIVALVAGDLRLPILGDSGSKPVAPRQGRVSWAEHLHQALLSLPFGVMFFEQIYEPGPDGRDHLRKLAPRFPTSLRKIRVARDGGLEGIVQAPAPGSTGKPPVIPVDRLVAYAHDPGDASWQGRSVLRPAYKHWILRDELLRLEVAALDRNSMGVPVYYSSPLAPDAQKEIRSGLELASSLRNGAEAAASLPEGAKLEIQGISGQLASPREAIAYHDSMISRSVLAHFLNLEGKGGSYALAETQSDLFVQSLQTIGEWIASTATQHIVEDLVRVAFPEHEGMCPRVTFDPIASKKEYTSADIAALINAGAIMPDRDLEAELRRRGGLPEKRPFEDAMAEKAENDAVREKYGVSPPDDSDQGVNDQ